MGKINGDIIHLIRKVRGALHSGQITVENFPFADIVQLIDDTIGASYWNCTGSTENKGFAAMTSGYTSLFQHFLQQKDMAGCEQLLFLFECSYLALYGAMDEGEEMFRQRPYRQLIHELGDQAAYVQYRLHKERQRTLGQDDKSWVASGIMQGKGVVYTCVEGEAVPAQPREVHPAWEWICFTDRKEKHGTQDGVWKYCWAEEAQSLGKRVWKQKYKILCHEIWPEYDYSIYLDPDIVVLGNLREFAAVYGEGHSFLGFPLLKEECLYEDISYTDMVDDDENISIRRKIFQYEKEGYPRYHGLLDGRVMIRSHKDEKLCQVLELWWRECQEAGWYADHIFHYAAWKLQYFFALSNLFLEENRYFKNRIIDLQCADEL